MNIDMHFHMLPPFFIEELKRDNPWRKQVEERPNGSMVLRIGRLAFPLEPNHFDASALVAAMDVTEIDVAAISPSPILFHNHMDGTLVSDLYRRTNDHLIDLRHEHPGRFRPLGTVFLPDVNGAIEELHRLMDAGLSGVEIETNIAGRNLDDPAFRPWFHAAEALGAVVFLHPLAVLGADRLGAYYLTNLIGNPTDTAVAAASLIFGGVMDACPSLKIVLPHGGGSTPCLCGRWDHGATVRAELAHIAEAPSKTLRKFYFDTLTHSDAALSLLLDVVGASQLVLGSDHPYDMGDTSQVARIRARTDLDEAQRAAILGGNARRLLGI